MNIPYLTPGRPSLRSVLQIVLVAAAAVPFFLSLAAHAFGPAAQQPAKTAEDRPALAFDQYMVNFGRIEPQGTVSARYGFTNRGRHPVAIRELNPSCGCLQPRLSKRVYGPGESGTLYLPVLTANQESGPKEYFVRVSYEDPEPREVTLTLKLIVPQRHVAVRPSALIFYQINPVPTTREVIVTDYRGKRLRLTGVGSTSELVSAKIGSTERGTAGIRHIPVEVTVRGRVPPGTHRVLLTIETDDPEYPQLRVPLMIHGPTGEAPPSARHDGHGAHRR